MKKALLYCDELVTSLMNWLREALDELDGYYKQEYGGEHPYNVRKLAHARAYWDDARRVVAQEREHGSRPMEMTGIDMLSDAEVREIGNRLARLRDALDGSELSIYLDDGVCRVVLEPPPPNDMYDAVLGNGYDFETALRNAIKRAPWLRAD